MMHIVISESMDAPAVAEATTRNFFALFQGASAVA